MSDIFQQAYGYVTGSSTPSAMPRASAAVTGGLSIAAVVGAYLAYRYFKKGSLI